MGYVKFKIKWNLGKLVLVLCPEGACGVMEIFQNTLILAFEVFVLPAIHTFGFALFCSFLAHCCAIWINSYDEFEIIFRKIGP